MIVCVGCGGRNDPSADSCVFCQRRLASGGRGRSSTATLTPGAESPTPAASPSLPRGAVMGVVLVVLAVVLIAASVLLLPRLSTLFTAV